MQEQIGMMRVGAGLGALAMLAALAGCGEQTPSGSRRGAAGTTADGAAGDDGKVDCALGGSGEWGHDCVVERAGKMLTIRHADGGFRRFRVLDDGHGLEAADGAEAAKLTILDDKRIEVVAGADRYRLPARIGGSER